jgi:Mg/Co/Ni transporter MgtE
VAVVDAGNHLLGAITVDDVLDRALPRNWRREQLTSNASELSAVRGTS